MATITEKIENQRLGKKVFKETNGLLKNLCGFTSYVNGVSSCPIFASRFSPFVNFRDVVAISNEDGEIQIQDTSKKRSPVVVQAHNNAVFDLMWTQQSPRLISGSGDYSAALWDLGCGSIKHLLSCKGHTRSLKTISCHPSSDDVFATGGRDGVIMIWDSRSVRDSSTSPDNRIITCPSPDFGFKTGPKPVDTITSVVYLNDHALMSASAGEGSLKLWDTRKSYMMYRKLPTPSHVIPYPGSRNSHGYSCLVLSPCRLHLYANCIDNTLYRFTVGNNDFKLSGKFVGHEVSSFYIKHCLSPDGTFLVSGSGSGSGCVWEVSSPGEPMLTLHGHTAELTAVDWSHNPLTKLVTSSEDASYMLWDLHMENEAVSIKCQMSGFVKALRPHRKEKKPFSSCWLSCKKEPYRTPVKKSVAKLTPSPVKSLQSAAKRLKFSSDTTELASPTAGLPNYVLEGTSPHQHRCGRKPADSPNWLARLADTGPKVSPRPTRRTQRSRSDSKVNLLNYFKKASRKPKCLDFTSQPTPS